MTPRAFLRRFAPGAILLVLGCIAGASYALAPFAIRAFTGHASLTAYADDIIRTCANASYIPSCYDEEIPKLMDRGISMEDAFKVTSIIQGKTNGYFYCHVLGHKLAEKETAKDPSKWTDVIGRCPTGMCSNGCLHGAAQERFRAESLTDSQIQEVIPQLKSICTTARSYTGLEQASCFHSLGHLTMYLTNGAINNAVGVCDQIANDGTRDNSVLCYEGAYMQIFQPLEPEDFGLVRAIAPTTTAAAETFCDAADGERRAACHRESWPLYRATIQKPEGLKAFCSLTPGKAHEDRCYSALFYVITAQLGFNGARSEAFCNGIGADRKAQCFANAASRFIETDYRLAPNAAALCKAADAAGVGDRCYTELLFYSTFNFHPGSPEFTKLCETLPEPWKTKCLAGEGSRIHSTSSYTSD